MILEVKPTDSRKITVQARKKALAAFNIPDAQPLAVGTEAEVYLYNETTLLKLYANTNHDQFDTLQHFYENLDSSNVTITLPKIISITPMDDLIVVLEARIEGIPLENLLANLGEDDHNRAEKLYLDAVFDLTDIRFIKPIETYLLFDPHAISATQAQDFNRFYAKLLEEKIQRVAPYMSLAYPSFSEKAAALVMAIRNSPMKHLSIIHGDFFPGNILVNPQLTQVHGIIDFGSFTMFGNRLLDIAGAFSFYRMYDPARLTIRERMLAKIMDRLPRDEHAQFFWFLLANAILTSDLYALEADPSTDHHFQWALEIVSNDFYWKQAILV